MENATAVDMKKIASYLRGEAAPEDVLEAEKLKTLLTNYNKVGNAFIGFALYSSIKRVGRMLTALDVLEERMYKKETLENLTEPREIMEMIMAISGVVDKCMQFIQMASNKTKDSKYTTQNFLINITADTIAESKTADNETVLDREERKRLREMAARFITMTQKNDVA